MKLFKKIDLYYQGDYITSTMQSKTCKEAKARFLHAAIKSPSLLERHIALYPQGLKAHFSK